jgi:glycosyltransferase involved in cell wall biosynthesis
MIKVVLIYRKRSWGAYSIEELFQAIAGELRKHADVIEYERGTRWNILNDIWRLRKMQADIYHVTGSVNWLTLLLPNNKTVLTVPDIGHYLFGLKGFKRCLYKWLWLVWPICSAGVVTSGSNETRNNIMKYLGIKEDRIQVIENCHSPIFHPVHSQFKADRPVILQVGTKPYKNVPRLIEALKGLRCQLVLIGQLDAEIRLKLSECNVDYENHVGLSHAELYQKYVECDIVSFISIGEGFGVPIIEAQATGRPLITSNISPLRDVAGEGACLVDPLDMLQIRQGIKKIIEDADYRNQLVEKGLQNVIRYSPATISSRYYDLYKKLVSYEKKDF